MPTWGQLLPELEGIIEKFKTQGPPEPNVSPHDVLRRKYLAELHAKTGRATILYYSGWLEQRGAAPNALSVDISDIAGFMEACSNVVDLKELDLFVHSPGGDPDAAEQICGYLRTQFDHIRAIVPMAAMSAATMIALSADEVIMGAHSQLGPIDPQFTIATPEGPRSASAQAIRDQFDLAREQCRDPKNLPAWMPILRTFAPGLLAACDHAAARAQAIVALALEKHMFKDKDDPATRAAETAAWFGNAEEFLSHGRPVRRDEAREHEVVVRDLEDDGKLQDLMLTVHHAAMLTLGQTPTLKIIENHEGRAWVQGSPQIVLPQIEVQGPVIPGPPAPGQPGGPPSAPSTPDPAVRGGQRAERRRQEREQAKRKK